jgi:hypothetical protein
MQLRNDGKGIEPPRRLIVLGDSNDSSPPTTQGPEQGDMGFEIKSRVTASPSGALGPMVLIVADSELRQNLMVVQSNAPKLKRALINALMSENCNESILSTSRSRREQLNERI